MTKKIDAFLKFFFAYVTIVGLITFSCFIMEEAIQMCTFGTWPAQDAGAWVLVEQNLQKMEKITVTLDTVNKYCGWLQPFAYIAYDAYVESTYAYIQSVRQKIATIMPEALVEQQVTIIFMPRSMDILENGYGRIRLGSLTINSKTSLTTKHTTCTGTIRRDSNGKCFLNCN